MSFIRMPLWLLWALTPFIVIASPAEDRLACLAGIALLSALAIAWAPVRRWIDADMAAGAARYHERQRQQHP